MPPSGIYPGEATELLDDLLDTTVGSFWNKTAQLRKARWADVPPAQRQRLIDLLVDHPDPGVRSLAHAPLALWNRTRELCDLVNDEHALVRKAAMHALASVEPTVRVADLAAARLDETSGTAATESLDTWFLHADSATTAEVLEQLAATDRRFSVRSHAIDLLAQSGAVDAIARLAPVFNEPPEVNWHVHLALLSCTPAELFDRSRLKQLVETDNLDISVAAAQALANHASPTIRT